MLAKGIVPRSIVDLVSGTVQNYFGIYRVTGPEAWNRIVPPPLLTAEELESLLAELESLVASVDGQLAKALTTALPLCRGGQWDRFLDTSLASNGLEGRFTYYKKPVPAAVRSVYERLIAHSRAVLLKIWSEQIQGIRDLLVQYDSIRRRLQNESLALRFDDIAFALAERMSAVGAAALVHRLDGEIEHLLLDEFQDTSLLQWDVLRPFVKSLDDRDNSSFFCVGDVKQAIYGWRGGVAALFDKVEREVPGLRLGS